MGAPKQKWTSEEESALKSGVIKHGPGKWRTILKDPEFSGVLYLRSNVDLKDKWRNMHAIANGLGPRDKCTITVRRMPHVARHDEASLALSIVPGAEDMMDGKTNASVHGVHSSSMQVAGSKKSKIRIENLIMEAISTLNEPSGSHKTSIANYIEEQYWPPHDFKGILSTKLKHLTARGKLIKVKRRYRITPTFCEKTTPSLMSDERPLISPRVERGDINMLTKSQIDIELAKMRTMTPDEAAAAAARAVTEAEAAIAEAEEAAREAEAAEADAEAAQAFAEAAMKTLRARTAPKMVINYGGQSLQNRVLLTLLFSFYFPLRVFFVTIYHRRCAE